MKLIECLIECTTKEFSKVLEEAGIDQPTEFRRGYIASDKIVSFYERSEGEKGTFIEINDGKTVIVLDSIDELYRKVTEKK